MRRQMVSTMYNNDNNDNSIDSYNSNNSSSNNDNLYIYIALFY